MLKMFVAISLLFAFGFFTAAATSLPADNPKLEAMKPRPDNKAHKCFADGGQWDRERRRCIYTN